MTVRFTVPGVPAAKERPRMSTRGNVPRMYTPPKTARYEQLVALAAQEVMEGRAPTDQPVSMAIVAYVPIPKSASKKMQEQMRTGVVRPGKRPDLDNYIKAVQDGLNQVVYKDDNQIVALSAHKIYGDRPRLEVVISTKDIQEGGITA